jgi:hypothetical protein
VRGLQQCDMLPCAAHSSVCLSVYLSV